jgi:CRISP-associated protein Cas1
MPVLYLTEPQSVLRKTSDRLIVEKDGEELLVVPCAKLEAVLIFGNVQVTTPALVELWEHGIELAFLSPRGVLRGQLTPPKAKNLPLRMAQYDVARDPEKKLALAKAFVLGKIANARAVLLRFAANHPIPSLRGAIDTLEESLGSVEGAKDLATLRGWEGQAAAAYFAVFGELLPEALSFPGRRRRPPTDPVNSLLSFGYVLAGNELQSLLDARGFDPYLGFLHEIDYGRPSLALDLLEEFRPAWIDRFVIAALQRGQFEKEDFLRGTDGGLALDRDGLKRFFVVWESALAEEIAIGEGERTIRDLYRRQAERLARAIQYGEPYVPFELPC